MLELPVFADSPVSFCFLSAHGCARVCWLDPSVNKRFGDSTEDERFRLHKPNRPLNIMSSEISPKNIVMPLLEEVLKEARKLFLQRRKAVQEQHKVCEERERKARED